MTLRTLGTNTAQLNTTYASIAKAPVVNVMDYGAVAGNSGSTATNDTAVSNALATLAAYTGGHGKGVLQLPAGQLNVGTSLQNQLFSGVTIRGASKHSTYLTGSVAGPLISSAGSSGDQQSYCSIEDIYVHNTSTSSAAMAASLTYMSQLRLANAHFQAASTGSNSRVVYADSVWGFLADWCHFTGTGPDRGLDFDGTNPNTLLTVRDCSLTDTKNGARFVHVDVINYTGNHHEALQGSPVGGNTGCVTFDSCSTGVWDGNYFEACYDYGIICYAAVGTSRNHRIGPNRFYNMSTFALSVANLKYGTIEQQTIIPGPINANVNGIYAVGSDNLTIATPYLASGSGTALSATSATNLTILPLTSLTAKTADYTVTAIDKTVSVTGSTNTTQTLPSAVSVGAGRAHTIKNNGTGVLTIAATAGTLDGPASLGAGEAVTYQSNGTNWLATAFVGNGGSGPFTTDPRSFTGFGALNANQAVYLRVRGRGLITKVGFYVGTSSGNVDVAVYANNGSSGRSARPGARRASSGSTACPAAGYGEVTLSGSVYVNDGDWLAIAADNATATFGRTGSSSSVALADGLSHIQSTAFPLPSTAVASGTSQLISTILVGS